MKNTKLISGLTTEEEAKIKEVASNYHAIMGELKKCIVGMKDIIEQLMICVFSGNHAILVGVPGLAKTLLISSISKLLDLKFARIQFTPDLMPSDITGTEILVQDENLNKHFTYLRGPLFSNIILADELNRTPPKTQSALLEAMEENTITSIGQHFTLEPPFFVLATQNPIEQEGTYPLPAAQLDRFMFNLLVDYPTKEEEYKIVRLTVSSDLETLTPLLNRDDILELLQIVRKIHMSDDMMSYATRLCRNSRPSEKNAPEIIKNYVNWGVSPRACQCLILGSKARAMLAGRCSVIGDDIRAIAHPVMRHRIILNYKAEADNITPDEVIDHLIEEVVAPDGQNKIAIRKKYSQKLYISVFNN